MARTDISICSLALMKLGAAPISSFDTPGDVAKILKSVYPEIRSTIIGLYAWECMKVRKELTRESGTPSGAKYSFILPSEMQGTPIAAYWSDQPWVRATSGFEVRSRRLVTNYERIWLEFTAERPESEWPAWFADLVTSAVAAEIAFMVTDQQSVKDYWEYKTYGTPSEQRIGGLMGQAMAIDAQGSGNNPGLSDTAFIDARFGGVYPGDQW